MTFMTAWVGSTSVLVACSLAPLVVSFIIKVGTRPMIFTSSILLISGLTLTSIATEIWHLFLTYSILVGIHVCIVYSVCWGVLPLYFQKRRALAIGLANSGKHVGMAVVGPISRMAVAQYGWRKCLQLVSLLGLIMIICGILYRPLKVPSKTTAGREGKENSLSIGQIVVKSIKLHRDPLLTFWLLMIALSYSAYFVPSYHIVRHAEDNLNVSEERSGFLLTVMAVSAAVSTMTVGLISDYFVLQYKIVLLQVLLLLAGISTMLFSFYQTFTLLAIYVMVYGVATAFTALIPVIVAAVVSEEETTLAIGLASFYVSAAVIGPPIAGWMYDSSGTYNDSFFLFGLILVTAAVTISLHHVFARLQVKSCEQKQRTLPSQHNDDQEEKDILKFCVVMTKETTV
ncbi:monocarboxylate transporter 13-like isoform X2 [Corticium candelabrum]|uniref:monocarboxylate transporter 13-like isoform X2 n=1 Tax=Corticium candelabrum TaxID=121492 RepID=UPI002E25D5CA|nr:monocarboxylate transporter 13-like isoform X2 [Corticium candelabrum]XP_062514627.1 monocarboxylate transporter 13-like isoform X2 [Corticium candelabrum]